MIASDLLTYLGHFHFEQDDGGYARGYFTLVAQAASPSEVLAKFTDLIRRLKESEDLFRTVRVVYLDECVQVSQIPAAGFLDRFVLAFGSNDGEISAAALGTTAGHCTVLRSTGVHLDEGRIARQPFLVLD